ncbi:Uncharacterised protein [Streptococcus pneumoniae]|nr:Uncharacterised protein [Streptococcus pneumoniae]
MRFTHSFFCFATLRKSLQTTSASPYRMYESLIYNLKTVFEADFVSLIYNLLTSSVLSTTSKTAL